MGRSVRPKVVACRATSGHDARVAVDSILAWRFAELAI
jgi:hypothetical protein